MEVSQIIQNIRKLQEKSNLLSVEIRESREENESSKIITNLIAEFNDINEEIKSTKQSAGLFFMVWESKWNGTTYEPTNPVSIRFQNKTEAESELFSNFKQKEIEKKIKYSVLYTTDDLNGSYTFYY